MIPKRKYLWTSYVTIKSLNQQLRRSLCRKKKIVSNTAKENQSSEINSKRWARRKGIINFAVEKRERTENHAGRKKKKERQVMVEEKMGMTGTYSDDTSVGINMEQKFTEQHWQVRFFERSAEKRRQRSYIQTWKYWCKLLNCNWNFTRTIWKETIDHQSPLWKN